MASKINSTQTIYVFIDEVQNCKGFEKAVTSLFAKGGYNLFITGSNANMLSGDLATHLASRYIEVEVFPLTYSEYKNFSSYRFKQKKVMKHYFMSILNMRISRS